MNSQTDVFQSLAARLDPKAEAPLYRQLREQVARLIHDRYLRPGDGIPSQRQISQLCQVSEITVRRAMQELAAEGLLQARAGSGTVVAEAHTGDASVPGNGKSATRLCRIGIVLASLTDGYPFLPRMMQRLEAEAGERVRFQLFDMPTHETDPGEIGQILPLRGLDGLILMSPVNLALVALCQRQRVPYVLLYNDLADDSSRCVVVDYASGVIAAVRSLVEQGKKRIALVTAAKQRFSTGQMIDAYRTAFQLYGLTVRPEWIIHGGYAETQGYEATQQLLAMSPRPDAILFASDYQARGGLVALQKAKLAVPRDVAVVGAGKLLRDKEWPVALTSIDLHFDEVGLLAVQTLRDLIDGKDNTPLRQVVRSTLSRGETA